MADDHEQSRRGRGAQVEALARAYLERQGLRAVAANANYRFGELDLVMLEGDTLLFIEVRYRRGAAAKNHAAKSGAAKSDFGGAAASVDANKRRKLVAAAETFLLAHRAYAHNACRFDVIAASGDIEAPTFEWLRDAFRADDV